jgi:hypothetical protein
MTLRYAPPGTVVRPTDHPPGFPLWRVVTSDSSIVLLEPVDPHSPVARIRRRINTLRKGTP